MYIDKIDELLDNILDDFYVNVILYGFIDGKYNNILEESNFVRYQKDINTVLIEYIKTINVEEIRSIVKNEETVQNIVDMFNRYICYYFFITFGVKYKSKNELFITNIVEFTKKQSSHELKVKDFFNSKSNGNIIKNAVLSKKITKILEVEARDKIGLAEMAKKTEYREAFMLLNDLGTTYIDIAFRKNNENEKYHNIIKTIIIMNIYKKIDKINMMNIMENINEKKGDFIYIDIVVSKTDTLTMDIIESVLNEKEIQNGVAKIVWDMLNESDNQSVVTSSYGDGDKKIRNVLESGLFIPIVDDFMMFHKESENYDKNENSNDKTKENIRVKYIVNKIDMATDLYSDNSENARKVFDVSLQNRKAVIYNNTEDVKIINKYSGFVKKTQNDNYINELEFYRKYPYINFKNINGSGTNFSFAKSIDAMRFITLSDNKTKNIQLRVALKDEPVNIVGFLLKNNNLSGYYHKYAHHCAKNKNLVDLRTIGNKKNGYLLFLDYLRTSKMNTIKHRSLPYWLFDAEKDKWNTSTYEHDNFDDVRLMLLQLYDDIMKIIVELIMKKTENVENILPSSFVKYIRKVSKKLSIPLNENHEEYNELIKYCFSKKVKSVKPSYDASEDNIYGFNSDVIKLKSYTKDKKEEKSQLIVDIHKMIKIEQGDIKETINGVCQHIISWENVESQKKESHTIYSDMLYEFLEQYATENIEKELVCKSCGEILSMKKFIVDGSFNDNKQFVAFGTPMDVPLESLPEYAKYNIAIRIMGKTIEKVATIADIPSYAGSMPSSRTKRKNLIKDTIDLIIANNKKLRLNRDEKKRSNSKMYGINPDISHIWTFEIENNIFTQSSKDKDFYKNIKLNNILAYTLILMTIDIGENNIGYMYGDKKGACSYSMFDKYGHTLFDGLKIIKNRNKDLADVKKYKVLCYIIYYFSCYVTKYGMWFQEISSEKKQQGGAEKSGAEKSNVDNKADMEKPVSEKLVLEKKVGVKFNPVVQKIVIITIMDILNNILENGINSKSKVFNVFLLKFFNKLSEIFSANDLLNTLRSSIVTINDNKKSSEMLTVGENVAIPFNNDYLVEMTQNRPYYIKYLPALFKYVGRKSYIPKMFPSGISNCPNGKFHNWKPSKKNFVCTLCGVSASDIDISKTIVGDITKIVDGVYKSSLKSISNRLCPTGKPHNFLFDTKQEKYLCEYCKNPLNFEYSMGDFDKIEKAYINEIYEPKMFSMFEDKYVIKNKKNDDVDINKSIKSFVSYMYEILKIHKINDEINLNSDTYILDHDYMGRKLKEIIKISEKESQLVEKNNHPFFKKDVVYITVGKNEAYYDAYTLLMIGYKESGKQYNSVKTSARLKIIKSIMSKLQIFCFSSRYYDITEDYENIKRNITDYGLIGSTEIFVNDIVKNIIREQTNNIKKMIIDFVKLIHKLNNNYGSNQKTHDNSKNINKNIDDLYTYPSLENIYNKYRKTIKSIKMSKNDKVVFGDWMTVIYNIYGKDVDPKNYTVKNDSFIDSVEIMNINDSSKNTLVYLLSELEYLMEINKDNENKQHICSLIVESVNEAFKMFNNESVMNDNDMKAFIHRLSIPYYIDSEELGTTTVSNTEGIYDEYTDSEKKREDNLDVLNNSDNENVEKKIDDEEEADAMDIDYDPEDDEEDRDAMFYGDD